MMNDVEKLTVLLTQLGDGVRKRFDKSGPLTIEDMVKIITPPPHPLLIRGGDSIFPPCMMRHQ